LNWPLIIQQVYSYCEGVAKILNKEKTSELSDSYVDVVGNINGGGLHNLDAEGQVHLKQIPEE